MYDCLQDSYTDFSFAIFDAVGRPRPLCGSLSATPLPSGDDSALHDLAAFARDQGYDIDRCEQQLTVRDISLADALAINTRFGGALIISCDLRRDPPVRF
ncbi:hypothetical protein [Chromobacterium violaceum]|uniref:Uncharacterized protein n=2 Tax=Chromobacterium violaceum TaxID=536 RepID=A0A1R0MU32_CHRVL|nr:hypothetical protein [Chromobacterium violaceum]AAQ59270.1 hypothetical protein CV_1594 [Chromobacterium violaceum ATCC 12472]ATP28229.1 hypothetical protein CRN81_07370 [Chromobacterium violaceum]ATP32137.1 hypothetical protein CR207_07395 [Chromobacterium violaceum]KJH68728.1 hypothetical protein UF16_03690 [Chromobacterium violaceum]KMN51335.1 hypothetical protein VK93_03180 [Chromobacterium violaceum]